MFCTESCEHGCNATSSGKLISGSGAPPQPQQQQQSQQQYSMCYAPLSMPAQELGGKCEAEPPRVGMCLVTEGPEGLSIDCNVPLPNSFNLDEYRKQTVCSYNPSANGGGYFEGFCLPPPATVSLNPIQTSASLSTNQTTACNFQCQCCPVEAGSSFDTLSMQTTTSPASGPCALPSLPARPLRPEPAMTVSQKAPGSAVLPQIFCLAAPTPPMSETEGSWYPTDQQPAYLYNLVPAQSVPPVWNVQAINLVPVGVPVPQPQHLSQHLPQQQLVANPAQNSQLPTQQLVRYDLPFPRLLAELRRERDRSYCESPTQLPLAFQLYAPAHTVTFCEPPGAVASPTVPKRDGLSAAPPPDPMPVPSAPPPPPPPPPDSAGLARGRSDSPKRSRSCPRNKEQWESSGAAQSHVPYPSAAQHGPGNVCMKCGNCWHCPRCSYSNCFWHPGLVRAPPRDSR